MHFPIVRKAQCRLILAKVGWRLEFRLLNQLLLEIYYRFVTTQIFTGRSYSRGSRHHAAELSRRDLYSFMSWFE